MTQWIFIRVLKENLYHLTVVASLLTEVNSSQWEMDCSERTSIYKSFWRFLLWHMLCKSQHFNTTSEILDLGLDGVFVQCACAWFCIGTSNIEHNKQLFPSLWGTKMKNFTSSWRLQSQNRPISISISNFTPDSPHTHTHTHQSIITFWTVTYRSTAYEILLYVRLSYAELSLTKMRGHPL